MSEKRVSSTGAPLGTALSPFLFTLYSDFQNNSDTMYFLMKLRFFNVCAYLLQVCGAEGNLICSSISDSKKLNKLTARSVVKTALEPQELIVKKECVKAA